MIIFFNGPDDYRREEGKNRVIAEFIKKHSRFGVESFDLEYEEARALFMEFLRNESIFTEQRLAVLTNPLTVAEDEKVRTELQKIASRDGITALLSTSDDPPKTMDFLFGKTVLHRRFVYFKGPGWNEFIRSEAGKRGMQLEIGAIGLLAEVYLGNTWGLITELDKVSCLGGSIKKEALDSLGLEVLPDYWTTFSGLKSRTIAPRIMALERLFQLNEPPLKIFNILASQWKEKTKEMAEYDFAVKSGKMDYEEALLDLAIS